MNSGLAYILSKIEMKGVTPVPIQIINKFNFVLELISSVGSLRILVGWTLKLILGLFIYPIY
jgi:hypothetical protein